MWFGHVKCKGDTDWMKRVIVVVVVSFIEKPLLIVMTVTKCTVF